MAEKCPRKLVQVRNVIRLNQRLNYENSDQILALDVLLFVQIKMLFATTILALRLYEVLSFCNRSPCDSPAIETGSESHSTF